MEMRDDEQIEEHEGGSEREREGAQDARVFGLAE